MKTAATITFTVLALVTSAIWVTLGGPQPQTIESIADEQATPTNGDAAEQTTSTIAETRQPERPAKEEPRPNMKTTEKQKVKTPGAPPDTPPRHQETERSLATPTSIVVTNAANAHGKAFETEKEK